MNLRPRVVHLSSGKSFRGGERQTLWLHQGLLREGLDSLLICKTGGALSQAQEPHVQQLPFRAGFDPGGLRLLGKAIAKAKPDVIHCHDGRSLTGGVLAGMRLGVPVCVTRRIVLPIRGNRLTKWKYRSCAGVIAISTAVARECAGVVPEQRIHLVHSGVRWDVPMLSRAEGRDALGLPKDGFVVGTVAHLTEEKNTALLCALARRLASESPGSVVVCVGPCSEDVREQLTSTDNVRVTGELRDPARYYAAFDVYVSTSRHEGLGTALLDAVVRDIPAVATDGGGTADIFPPQWELIAPDDHEGFADRVVAVRHDYRIACDRAAECGRVARERFSVPGMVRGTIAVYERMLRR